MKRLPGISHAGAWSRSVFLVFFLCLNASAAGLVVHRDAPTLDRWMYPFGFDRGSETGAPTFASFDPRFDTRDGQFLLGWDLDSSVPTKLPPSRYLIKSLRVTVRCGSDETFNYDPTPDDIRTYMTNSPNYVVDADLGRPVDLVGVGFRGGFTSETFLENSDYGATGSFTSDNISIETRNAYGAVFDGNGQLVDISNNVGQTNPAFTGAPFDFAPWATAQTTAVEPGALVPVDTDFTFDVNLQDPLVAGYLQSALHDGRLRLIVTSLHPSVQVGIGGGGSSYPRWYTKENLLGVPAQMDLEVTVVGEVDSDSDGLPDDWEQFYFGNLDAAAGDDPDKDGATNLQEFLAGTDPRRADSVFKVTAYQRMDGAAVLRFPLAAGRQYVVERSDDLKSWGPANGVLKFPAPGIAEWTEQDLTVPPVEPPLRFHRVRVL